MSHVKVAGWVWKNLAVVTLLAVVIGGTWIGVRVANNSDHVAELAQQNRERIGDIDHESRARDAAIQLSRIFACRLFYDSVSELLKPYNPHPPTVASRAFSHRLAVLKARCPAQILKPRETK